MTLSSDSIDQTAHLLTSPDTENRAYGLELVRQLPPEARWQVAWRLTDVSLSRWRLAAECLLPEPLIEHRLRRFTARCVLRQLQQERAAGREPADHAWRSLELCELLGEVRGIRSRKHIWELEQKRALLDECMDPWESDYWGFASFFGDAEVDLDAVDVVGGQWDSLTRLPLEPLLRQPEEAGFSVTDRTTERIIEASFAASNAIREPGESEWGEEEDYLPRPRTRREWAWQRRAWKRIVIEGGDGLDLVFSRPGSPGPRRSAGTWSSPPSAPLPALCRSRSPGCSSPAPTTPAARSPAPR